MEQELKKNKNVAFGSFLNPYERQPTRSNVKINQELGLAYLGDQKCKKCSKLASYLPIETMVCKMRSAKSLFLEGILVKLQKPDVRCTQ